MPNNLKRATCAFFALLLVFWASVPAFAAEEDPLSAEIDAIFEFLISHDGADSAQSWLDGALTDGAGSGTEWYVIALRQYFKDLDYTAYANALEAKMNAGAIRGAVSRQRCALALAACGREKNAAACLAADETPGAQGIMSLIFGLHLLRAGVPSSVHTTDELIGALLAARLSDGGWAVMGGRSNVDVTAMALQALAPYTKTDSTVREATDTALGILSHELRESGTYQSYGAENPESAAQAVIALSALGIDPAADARFITAKNVTLIDGINAFGLAGGGFCHTYGGGFNATATVQSLLSLISVRRLRSGMSSLYIFDNDTDAPQTSAPPTDTSAADSFSVTTAAAVTSASTQTEAEKTFPVKPAVCISIALAAFAICIFICIRGGWNKKSRKSIIFIAAAAALVILFVALTRFSTPEGYYSPDTSDTRTSAGTVTVSVRCDTVSGKTASQDIPADGVILDTVSLPINEGNTVYDLLIAAARQYEIQVDHSGSGSMVYISGINYLYEFDFGELSGWIYRVNGAEPSVGCGAYTLHDGDRVEWIYTCALGADIK